MNTKKNVCSFSLQLRVPNQNKISAEERIEQEKEMEKE